MWGFPAEAEPAGLPGSGGQRVKVAGWLLAARQCDVKSGSAPAAAGDWGSS